MNVQRIESVLSNKESSDDQWREAFLSILSLPYQGIIDHFDVLTAQKIIKSIAKLFCVHAETFFGKRVIVHSISIL